MNIEEGAQEQTPKGIFKMAGKNNSQVFHTYSTIGFLAVARKLGVFIRELDSMSGILIDVFKYLLVKCSDFLNFVKFWKKAVNADNL